MAQRLAEEKKTARIAVVGAETRTGTLLREALAGSRVPGSRVNLYAAASGEVVISEYAGEARLIQDPDLPEIVSHEVIYLCEPGELTRQVILSAGLDATVIDLIGCLPDDVESRRIHPEINPGALEGHTGYLRIPDPLAMALAELLHGVEQALGIDRAVANVLRPASDFGQAGVEELREQTVGLLGFSEVPTETFGAQLAFNILGESASSTAAPQSGAQISEEVRDVLGWERQRLALSCLTVPLFYGHGVQLHLTLRKPAELADLRRVLAASPFFGPPIPASEATPLQVASENKTLVTEPHDDGLGGFWIWAVVGEAASRWASQAVRLSRTRGTSR